MKRRTLIKTAAWTGLGTMLTQEYGLALDVDEAEDEIKVGIITDLHFGNLAPDGVARFEVFARAVEKANPDHIVQLGDFCHPEDEARPLMEKWNALKTDKYHVLGNHDMDKGSKDDIQKFWGMEERYYHFDQNGWRFIVLDMNHIRKGDQYIPYGNANFYVDGSMRTWADPEQLEWLDRTLAESNLPVIIYTHQPIGSRPDAPQQRPILDIIKRNTTKRDRPKTRAVICGHQHSDWHREIEGVHHVCINSASYLWKDGRPWAYKDSLFSFMEIKAGKLTLSGMETTWAQRPEGVDQVPAITSRDIRI